MRMKRRQACLLLASAPAAAANFATAPSEQTWLGPQYWANRLQDWRLSDGRIECAVAGGDRNVYLLTHELSKRLEPFEIRAKLGRLDQAGEGFAGFRVGMRGLFDDYRDTAIYGIGLDAGVLSDGRLFIGSPEVASTGKVPLEDIELVLRGEPNGASFDLVLTASGSEVRRTGIPPDWLVGGIALVCSSGPVEKSPDPLRNVVTLSGINRKGRENTGGLRFWFRHWTASGPKFDIHLERSWGPILFAMHTLSRGVLKLTAQMAPVASTELVRLEVQRAGRWRLAGRAKIDPLSRTASFRVANWPDTSDVPYRLRFRSGEETTYEGTIHRDPRDKRKIVVAGLSCINDLGFPHQEIVRGLKHFRPDLLLFTGDQIYERSASYGIERLPLERACLDYLRKWYLFGWTFRDLLRDTPAVCMPDDHDVYHGNVWGAGGRHTEGGFGQPAQDSGGYMEPAEWVNVVQRTQTSHLPDPFDPAPVEQNISVYYTDLLCGGVSFAIVEDRKWKSAPKVAIPKARIVNGWAQNPEYRAPVDGDVPGAQLLGERQIRFLKHWAADWSGGAWIKAVVSQTIFANVATLPAPANTDAVTPNLPILASTEYPEGEIPVADHDSNGWPQTPRNEAIRAIRRALALHIAGDQHLGSTIQYGADEWNDGAWAICVPAVSNLFPRRWYPPEPGRNRRTDAPRNTGEYLDGFGNKVTVHAVFNPAIVDGGANPVNLRATGYGIIEFDRLTNEVTLTNWPRWVDPAGPGAKPCPGWPIVVRPADNGLPRTEIYLRPVRSDIGSLVEVREAASGEHVYTYRMTETSFRPPVPRRGRYRVAVRTSGNKILTQTQEDA